MSHSEFSWNSKAGQNIFAQEWKSTSPKGVVVLVHGLGEHSGRYAHVAETLNQAGFALLAFDLPGHGKSAGPRGHTSYDEVMGVIDLALNDAQKRYPQLRRFLYGHSLGGSLVLNYALKRSPQVQGVVATSPGIATGAPVPGWKLVLARVMARMNPAFAMANGLDRQNLSRDPAVIDAYNADPLVHDRISARLGLDLLTTGEWLLANAARFPVPLLLEVGSKDHLVSPAAVRAFAQAAPADKVTFKEWEGQLHETHNETEKESVLQYMVDWLNHHV